MPVDTSEYIHSTHLSIFSRTAAELNCHLLVRKTGSPSMRWIGAAGYTGKRADLKAKTGKRDVGRWKTAGLVCSPLIHPSAAIDATELGKARKEWSKSSHLISTPKGGFDDDVFYTDCRTPYMLQNDPAHPHYGCVALVDMGLLKPRYVHGDYDLYGVIPAGSPFDPDKLAVTERRIGSGMAPASLTQQEKAKLSVPNLVGPLSFRLSTLINIRIAAISADMLGALMVNHGAQLNLGKDGQKDEPVLAVMPRPRNGSVYQELLNLDQIQAFYQTT